MTNNVLSHDEQNERLKNARTQAEAMAKKKLNNFSPELQGELMDWVKSFVEQKTHFISGTNERVDYPRFGMLADLLGRTPVRIYDLPELKLRCDTAFVDTTGRMYMSDSFFRILVKEQLEGKNSLYFLFLHEMEHNRRLHLQRMLDYPSDLANHAQDIRINCDCIKIIACDEFVSANLRMPSIDELHKEIENLYPCLGPSIKAGCAMQDFSEFVKWHAMSEEAIAAELFKDQQSKDHDQQNQTEISFPQLCEGVAQDLDAMSNLAVKNNSQIIQAECSNTSILSRQVGTAKGKVTSKIISDLYMGLDAALITQEMTERNIQHSNIAQAATLTNSKVKSVNSGDDTINSWSPIERLSALKQVLENILNPSNSQSSPSNGSGIKIKDLNLPRSNPSNGKSENGSSNDPSNNSSKHKNIYPGDDHVMSAEELAKILHDSGVHEASKLLGYDDLEKISAQENAALNNITGVINKAADDVIKIGGVYNGAHMVDYASAQMINFFRPVLTWKMSVKKIIEELGNRIRFEHEEPYQQYYSSAEDQGLDTEDDIGYVGSYVSGGTNRALVIHIIDSSGSVTDTMLTRFVTEAINSARETSSGENAPEVIIIFADTIARGEPIFIDENNYEEFLKSGINYGGRGGTNFTASVQNVFKMLDPKNNEYSSPDLLRFKGRPIDAMIYFTDTFDAPPNQTMIEETAFECGMKRLPTMLFLAPKECYSDSFKQGVSNYADCIFFDKNELDIDIDCIEANISEKNMRTISF